MKQGFIVFVLGLIGALTAPVKADEVQINLAGDAFAFDQSPALSVEGLAPGVDIVVRLEAIDSADTAWWGQAVFRVDSAGRIDPAVQAPLRGTYAGVHPAGIFWSMVGGRQFDTDENARLTLTVADLDGAVLAERQAVWMSPRSDGVVEAAPVALPQLAATLYQPANASQPRPLVIVLGGSGGGDNTERASLLASHGYAVLDIGYFGAPGTTRYFVETRPLEHFMAAVDALQDYPGVDGSRIAVMGRSYGGQLALLWAAHDPRIGAVVAEVPSDFVTSTSATYPFGEAVSAWSINARPFAFRRADTAHEGEEDIAVERINGPILMITGLDDEVWPASDMAEAMVARLDRAGFRHAVTHHSYPDAGHNFGGGEQSYGVPHLPPKDRGRGNGGSTAGNSNAAIAAWGETLEFLQHAIGDPDAQH